MKLERMPRMLLVVSAALLFAIVLVACATSDDSLADSDANGNLSEAVVTEGTPAPDFFYTTTDGISGNLSDLRGKVVFLNFWASWCKFCVAEMPEIATLKANYPELEVLAVNVRDESQDAQNLIGESDYGFDWVLDEQGTIAALYPTDGLPSTIIIDRDGKVSSVFRGRPRDAYAVYEDALKQAGL